MIRQLEIRDMKRGNIIRNYVMVKKATEKLGFDVTAKKGSGTSPELESVL